MTIYEVPLEVCLVEMGRRSGLVTSGIDPYHALVACTLNHYTGRVHPSVSVTLDIILYEIASIFT